MITKKKTKLIYCKMKSLEKKQENYIYNKKKKIKELKNIKSDEAMIAKTKQKEEFMWVV
jgi:hypothetical protein